MTKTTEPEQGVAGLQPVSLLKEADCGGLFLKTLCFPEDNHKLVGKYFYTADQLCEAQVKVLRYAYQKIECIADLLDMADELEKGITSPE